MRTKHGVFIVNCFDNPRGYYWDAWYFGKFLGSFDYQSDAYSEFNAEMMKGRLND